MAKTESNKTTAADVIAEAEAANLLHEEKSIPKQGAGLNDANVPDGGNEAGYTEDKDLSGETDAPKASFRDRLKNVGEKLKSNKKGVIITLAVVGAAAVAVAKFTAKTVVEEIVESDSEETTTDDEKQDDSTPNAA
jgi:hypothetical protein